MYPMFNQLLLCREMSLLCISVLFLIIARKKDINMRVHANIRNAVEREDLRAFLGLFPQETCISSSENNKRRNYFSLFRRSELFNRKGSAHICMHKISMHKLRPQLVLMDKLCLLCICFFPFISLLE